MRWLDANVLAVCIVCGWVGGGGMLLCSLRWKWLEAALQSAECCLLRAVGCVVCDCDVCRGDVHGCVTHGVVHI